MLSSWDDKPRQDRLVQLGNQEMSLANHEVRAVVCELLSFLQQNEDDQDTLHAVF